MLARWTIVWTLRFALREFFFGAMLFALGWQAFQAWTPGADAGEFVPAVWMFGLIPYRCALAFGALLLLVAWAKGFKAKHRAMREQDAHMDTWELVGALVVPARSSACA